MGAANDDFPRNRYDFFKTSLLRHPVPLTNYQFQDNLGVHVAASVLAGTFATSLYTCFEAY